MAETYTTLGESTLSSGYTSGGVSLILASGSSFPSSGTFRVRADNEIFKVTAISGGTLTVVGAQEGTSASNHAFGTTVTEVLTAAAIDGIRSDITVIGAVASLPVSGMKAGDRYLTTDSVYEFVYDGAAWKAFFRGQPVIQPPLTGWTNITGGTWDVTNGYPYFLVPTSANNNFYGEYRTSPTAPYTIKALLDFDETGFPPGTSTGAQIACGIALSDGTKFVTFMIYVDSAGPALWTAKYSTTTSGATTYKLTQINNNAALQVFKSPRWLSIENDGTNLNFSWSIDGYHFKQFDTRLVSDFLGTITRFAIACNALNSTLNLAVYSLSGF